MPSGLDAPAAVRTGCGTYLTRSVLVVRRREISIFGSRPRCFSGPRREISKRFHFSEEHKEHGTLSLYTVTVRVIMDHMLNRFGLSYVCAPTGIASP